MGNDIIKIIMKYREGENEYLLRIVDIFNPVINKYSRILDGDDTRQDLIIQLIKVMEKIDLHNESFCKDKVIVTYIAKSIRNEYIRLSRLKSKETELNLDLDLAYEEEESEFEFLDTFKLLTPKEAYIMKLIYVYCLSISEISQYMNISRQAVNQAKNRALRKMKSMYIE